MNKKNYYEALGLITSQADVHPKLSKYYKSPNILIGAIKDLGEQGVIKLAESLTNSEMSLYIEHMTSGFIFEGVNITHPSLDETMMRSVDPIDYYGDYYEDYLHEGARYLMEDLDRKYGRETQESLDEYVLSFDITEFEKETIYNLLNKF